jgi:hypothetical protein
MLAACLAIIAIFAPDLIFCIRTGRAKVGRATPRRTISKEDRPTQYWANVYIVSAIIALAAAGAIWTLFFPSSFR